jgi:hypothetical protein
MRSWKPDVPFAGIPAGLGFTGGFSSPYDDAGRVRCARYHDPRGVHPMPSTSKKADVSKSFLIGDLEVKSIEFKLPEDEQDKALRLHKERLNFYFKDLGTLGFSALLVSVAVTCCLVFLFNSQSAPAEKDWARSVLMLVLTGAIGFAFGKATK